MGLGGFQLSDVMFSMFMLYPNHSWNPLPSFQYKTSYYWIMGLLEKHRFFFKNLCFFFIPKKKKVMDSKRIFMCN